MALKDEVCVATAGTYSKPGVHKLNPGWAERGKTGLCCRHLDAFTSICGFFSSPLSVTFIFFFLSFSLTLLTLSFFLHFPLSLPVPPSSVSCSTSEWRADVAWDVCVSNVEPLSYLPNRSLLFSDDRFELQGRGLFQDCIPNSPLSCTVCVCVRVCQMVRLDVGDDIPVSVV